MKLLECTSSDEYIQWSIANDIPANILAKEFYVNDWSATPRAILNWIDSNANWVWYHIELRDCSFDISKIAITVPGCYQIYTDKSFSEIPSLKKALMEMNPNATD